MINKELLDKAKKKFMPIPYANIGTTKDMEAVRQIALRHLDNFIKSVEGN